MEEATPKGRIEEIAFEKLVQRGWTIEGGERRGIDLDLFVSYEGTKGTMCFRNAFSVPKGAEANASTNPCFVRIELGVQAGEPTRWALWDRYSFPSGEHSPTLVATIVHEAIGEGWTMVAGADVTPAQSWYSPYAALDTILTSAEVLAPSREESERRAALVRTQRHNFGVHEKTLSKPVWVVLFFFLVVGPAVFHYAAFSEVANMLEWVLGTIIVSIPIFIFACMVLAAAIRRARRPRAPVEGMADVVSTLRATGCFESFQLTPMKVRQGLPVIVGEQGHIDEGRAPLSISRVAASSSRHGVTLDADLCVVAWPDVVNPEAPFLPKRWLTMDLKGAPEELAKLPVHHRSDQLEDGVRWHFKEEELERDLEPMFRNATASLIGGSAPYR